ncbi:PAS domain-containing sensor histidine kinase [Fulvivirga sp.]|uniref:sensor histidine kinase n=1 Tax=Fulvivirga sp. TaxID=1931237 RepID=UPI0032ED5E12
MNQSANSQFFRNLYLGSHSNIEKTDTAKRAILTGQLSLFCAIIAIFYTFFDLWQGAKSSFIVYQLLFVLCLGSFFINRAGKHQVATFMLLLSANLILSFSVEKEAQETGVFMFFVPIIVGSFALFGFEQMNKAIVMSLFSLILCLVVYKYEFDFVQKSVIPPGGVQLNFMFNTTISAITACIIIIFILRLNNTAELKLEKISEELKMNKDRFELAIQGSSAGIWDWDAINDKLFLSPLLIDLLNYPPEKYENMTSDKLNKVVHPSDLPKIKAVLKEHLEDKKPFYKEVRIRKGDNTYIWVLLSGQAQWDEDGKPLRMVGTLLDINDKNKAFRQIEEQNVLLEKTNEELDRFVYSTSHDLKAPLSSILGLIQLARMTDAPDELGEYHNMMEKRIHTLNGFITDIIDYSRNTRLAIDTENVYLKPLIEEVVEGLQYYEHSQSIDIQILIPDDISIDTDRGRLKIVLNNLIANAIKYHDMDKANPHILVSWEMKEQTAVIKIEDNGTGIEDELQDKIFNMFFRATQKSEGSGLGLYIAKEMTEKISGKIALESTYGEGTIFLLELPYQKVMEEANA